MAARTIIPGEPCPVGGDQLGQAIGEQVMLIRALLRDHGLDQDAETVPVPPALSLDKVEEQVCARHLPSPQSRSRISPNPVAGRSEPTEPRRHVRRPR